MQLSEETIELALKCLRYDSSEDDLYLYQIEHNNGFRDHSEVIARLSERVAAIKRAATELRAALEELDKGAFPTARDIAGALGGGALVPAEQFAAVPMRPFGKARPRVTRRGAYMPDSYTAARDELRWRFGAVTVEPPWSVWITAVRRMPKGTSKRKREELDGAPCVVKPDADNIAGAVLDALFAEDAAVVEVYCRKVWGEDDALEIRVCGYGD